MTILQPKNRLSIIDILANFSALLTLIGHILQPAMAQAQTLNVSQNTPTDSVIAESPASRLLNAKIDGPKPDKVVHSVITVYTSTPDQTDDTPFIAATGKRVHDGMIAANWLPFGTRIKIPSLYGDKIFTVEDRMNARYGYGRLDIWLDTSKAEAMKFGVKRLDVEVYFVKKELAAK